MLGSSAISAKRSLKPIEEALMASSAALVQRHAGERTQEISYELALNEFNYVAASAIAAGSFPATLASSLHWASNSTADWIVTVDADVIVLPSSIRRGLALAVQYPSNFFVIVSCIFDKFFGRIRAGGVRFYRRSLIAKALESSGWDAQIRPETALIQSMNARGHPSATVALLSGVHDFEQYFRDLYRTALVHGVKFRHHAEESLNRWNRLADEDDDFRIMIRGLKDGLNLATVSLDATIHQNAAAQALRDLELSEKGPLAHELFSDPSLLIPGPSHWLRADNLLSRRFPEFALKMANSERPAMLQTAFRHRALLLHRAPIRGS